MASLLESDMADKTVNEGGSFSHIIASYLSLVNGAPEFSPCFLLLLTRFTP